MFSKHSKSSTNLYTVNDKSIAIGGQKLSVTNSLLICYKLQMYSLSRISKRGLKREMYSKYNTIILMILIKTFFDIEIEKKTST